MSKGLAIVLLGAAAIAFVLGVVHLFELRFEAGDFYPPYSSLRSDPLGTMAFYESLGKLPGVSVSRDYRMSNELPYDADTLYLHLGAARYEWESVPEDLFHEIGAFLARGGRLVVAFSPETRAPVKPTPPDKDDAKNTDKKPTKKDIGTDDEKEENPEIPLKDKWGVSFGYVDLSESDDAMKPASVHNASGLPLPKTLDWHSGMVFSGLDKTWKTIYARGPNAVVIERRFGPGSVVMMSDSYLLSDEAMSKDRHADVLAWLVGANPHVVFDEAHFGIVDDPGIAGLIRQYHLAGLAAGLLLLAGLFIWKNLSSLVPPTAEEKSPGYVAGKDAGTGFVNLLRRNVPAADVLNACFAEWKKSSAGARPGVKVAEAQAVMDAENARPAPQRNQVEAYRRIAMILQQPAFSKEAPAPNPPPPL
jgi:hypothetical protein